MQAPIATCVAISLRSRNKAIKIINKIGGSMIFKAEDVACEVLRILQINGASSELLFEAEQLLDSAGDADYDSGRDTLYGAACAMVQQASTDYRLGYLERRIEGQSGSEVETHKRMSLELQTILKRMMGA
jgi:hypothetical protein